MEIVCFGIVNDGAYIFNIGNSTFGVKLEKVRFDYLNIIFMYGKD
jgi:hypothetical protein